MSVPERLFLDKAIGACIGTLAFVALAYIAWYLLWQPLWRWTIVAFWHWIPAFFVFSILASAPIMPIINTVRIVREAPVNRRRFWWGRAAFVGVVVLALLVLWTFTARPSWWASEYWWSWAVSVLIVSIASAGARMFMVVQVVGAKEKRLDFAHEWRFNKIDKKSLPALGLAMSGGGIRSAAFNLGVLQCLQKKNILPSVDVMSAVSGGSYIMSWYLLQPFYASKVTPDDEAPFNFDDVINEMFEPNGRFQTYLRARPFVINKISAGISTMIGLTLGQVQRAMVVASDDVDAYNSQSTIRKEYRHGIQTLFHGHPIPNSNNEIGNKMSTKEKINSDFGDFADVTPVTYEELSAFAEEHRLPFFIFNCAVLVERSHRHMLWPVAFELTADELGSDLLGYRTWVDLVESERAEKNERRAREYQSTIFPAGEKKLPGRWVHLVNVAPEISGAALGLSNFNPKNKARTMKLITWLPYVGNVDLGFLFPRKIWPNKGAFYASDGGHAENLGAYALIRRHCKTIVIVDAEHEKKVPYKFKAYTKLKKQLKMELDFCLTVHDIDSYLETKPDRPSKDVMYGNVTSLQSPKGPVLLISSLIYIKLSLDRELLGDYYPSIGAYAKKNPVFPHDPTSNQSYQPEQFDAYRDLGFYLAEKIDLPKK
jgi:hypothetical protein